MFQFFNNFGDKIIEARLLFFSRLKSPVTSLSSTYTRLKAARPEVATEIIVGGDVLEIHSRHPEDKTLKEDKRAQKT